VLDAKILIIQSKTRLISHAQTAIRDSGGGGTLFNWLELPFIGMLL
jgi:hypothetical protein